MTEYGCNSGQVVNYQKSGIFFSANVRRDKQQVIKDILGVQNELGDSKYLGLPSLVGKSRKKVFNFVKERVWRKVQDWSHKILSKAGKTVMVKNVGQSIPSYAMSCFMLPKSLCTEIERLLNGYWWSSNGNENKGIRWLAWDKMATAKCMGGLGFRNLHGFNIALLGKHVWKFAHNPSSLVARIFKARYFSDRHILEAQKGTGSSFIWSGIWEAKENLKKGFRWVLGNGEEIRVLKDPWLKGKLDFCVEDSHLNNVRDERACQYFRSNSRDWDVQKVQHDFHHNDIEFILQRRIPQYNAKDRIIWAGSNQGQYTVKSGYQFWTSQINSDQSVSDSKGWSKIWKMQVPHKVRTFLWRFCKNNVPVRYLIRGKGVATTIICPMCEVDIEHMCHLFCKCPYVVGCWQQLGLDTHLQVVESAPEWLLDVINKENAMVIEKCYGAFGSPETRKYGKEKYYHLQ